MRHFIQQSWDRAMWFANVQTHQSIIAPYRFHSRQPAPGFKIFHFRSRNGKLDYVMSPETIN